MPRALWFVVGFIVLAIAATLGLSARGPFASHPEIEYDQFLADFQAGSVAQIVRWNDQLEVTLDDAVVSVTVPADRDLMADLDTARWAGGVGINLTTLPGIWLSMMTPWVPFLIALAAVLIYGTAIVRNRRHAAPPDREPGAALA